MMMMMTTLITIMMVEVVVMTTLFESYQIAQKSPMNQILALMLVLLCLTMK